MKKILSLLVLLAVFTSCEEDVKFNTPAVQGLKDNDLWKATEFTATVGTDNSLTIQATNGFETLILKTSKTNARAYVLGVNEVDKASYSVAVDDLGLDYQTGTDLGSGEIKITPQDTDLVAGYITGTFHFRAISDDGDEVFFQNGVFYKVPITGVAQ